MSKKQYIKHGLSKDPLYKCYHRIKGRCNNKNNYDYKYYGGRGIKCKWNNFIDFYNDMKSTYKEGLEIDRINNNGNYCKENCRWATRKEQMNNYSNNIIINYNNKKYTLTELSEKFNINKSTLKGRIKYNVDINNLVYQGNLPKRKFNKYKKGIMIINGKSINDIANNLKITPTALRYRIKKFGINKSIKMPVDKNKGIFQPKIFIKYNNKKYTIKELSKKFNIKEDTLRNRLYRLNMPIKKALTKKV